MFMPIASEVSHVKRTNKLRPETVADTLLSLPNRVVVENMSFNNAARGQKGISTTEYTTKNPHSTASSSKKCLAAEM
jgi:hypothetical protein